ERVGEFTVNTGASFVASFYDATLALLRELRLDTSVPNPQLGVVATPFGKLELDLTSYGRILNFPLISLSGKLRPARTFAPAGLRRGTRRAGPVCRARLDVNETVARGGIRPVGETAYHYLRRTGIEPFFYIGCEQISAAFGKALVRHALKWNLLVLPAGMGALCDALAQRIEGRTGRQATGGDVADNAVVVPHTGGA